MSTPKPGQIRCPTCSRSTPPAAYCTQCGSPIPASARARPRGMDRDELEERVRQRRPGDAPFRRGVDPEEAYQPFAPEPEDHLAVHEPDAPEPPEAHVDNTAPGFDAQAPIVAEEYVPPEEPPEPVVYVDDEVDEPPVAYPYLAAAEERSESSALPLLGFAALAVMALAVGVILAGLFTGPSGVAESSSTPSPSLAASSQPSVAVESVPPSESAASEAPATPEPTDGPVAFPDGASMTVQPCGTYEFKADLSGCKVDGSTRDAGTVWILAVFHQAKGSDQLTLLLQQNGDTIDRRDTTIESHVPCGSRCSGLIWVVNYKDLSPGDYELVLRRNGDFADRATFTVK